MVLLQKWPRGGGPSCFFAPPSPLPSRASAGHHAAASQRLHQFPRQPPRPRAFFFADNIPYRQRRTRPPRAASAPAPRPPASRCRPASGSRQASRRPLPASVAPAGRQNPRRPSARGIERPAPSLRFALSLLPWLPPPEQKNSCAPFLDPLPAQRPGPPAAGSCALRSGS
jgi:hypothetical protein